MAAQVSTWQAAVRPYLYPHEVRILEEVLAANEDLQAQAEQAAAMENNDVGLVDLLKPYLLPPPAKGDFSSWNAYNRRMMEIDRRVYAKWMQLHDMKEPKYNVPKVKFSQLRSSWMPEEENPFSLGQYDSTEVDRVMARLQDVGLEDFSSFWARNSGVILAAIPKKLLLQRATDEANSDDSFRRQRDLLVKLAKAIAHARGVLVKITEDAPETESYFQIGERFASIERTKGCTEREIAKARGQIVILGNSLWRMRTRYQDFTSFENEVFGFVGTGSELQCLKQVHAYQKRVKCFDGPLLQLARGHPGPGELFEVDLDSEAGKWAAAALDRMVVTGAAMPCAAGDVLRGSYGSVEFRPIGGYWIGDQFLNVPMKQTSSLLVTVIGALRNNEVAMVLRVHWEGEVWWLKVGPEVESRHAALQEPDTLPTGGWERWFQTERDMLSRVQLSEGVESAFAVSLTGADRPAMLVKDVGDSLERQLFSRDTTPSDVYDMSKQVHELLKASSEQGVIHGDVCLENICYKDGRYSLIDWGLACGRPFSELVSAVDKAWPGLQVIDCPGIPNWEMSADCCFHGMRPSKMEHDMESLLYCCMKILGGRTLPWSDAACSEAEYEVLKLRTAAVASFVEAQGHHIYQPLLYKLGLLSSDPV